MTIYVDISAGVHNRAGLGRYAASLARALVAQEPGRFAFFYNQSGDVRPPAGLVGVPARTVRAGYKPWRMTVWLGQLAGLGFDRLLPDAELYHATEHLLMPMRRLPTVLTVHDLIFRIFPQHHKRLNYWYLNATMPLYCRRASAIIAVSQATQRDLVRLYGLDPAKITVVYEAAAPHFAPATPAQVAAVRARYDLPERYVLHVGTIEPRKNLSRLLEAIHRLRQARRRCAAGGGGQPGMALRGIFQRLEELALDDAVLLSGYVPDADLPALYSGATLAAVPSLYEGFGLPVLEAMACGTPVICSATSSLPEVGGDAARYFDPNDTEAIADALLGVWRAEGLREAMRGQGLARAAQFSWQRAAAETLKIYEQVSKVKKVES